MTKDMIQNGVSDEIPFFVFITLIVKQKCVYLR